MSGNIMNKISNKGISNYLDAYDSTTSVSKNSGATVYKKKTITDVIYNCFHHDVFTKPDIDSVVDEFVEHLKSIILSGCAILITDHGRLTTRLKDGGRTVRDIIRKHPVTMKTVGAVTFTKIVIPHENKKSVKCIVDEFKEKGKNIEKKSLNETVANVFFLLLRRTKSNVHRFEIRGLGVFHATSSSPRKCLHPKTRKSVEISERIHPRFKISPTFRKKLTISLQKK